MLLPVTSENANSASGCHSHHPRIRTQEESGGSVASFHQSFFHQSFFHQSFFHQSFFHQSFRRRKRKAAQTAPPPHCAISRNLSVRRKSRTVGSSTMTCACASRTSLIASMATGISVSESSAKTAAAVVHLTEVSERRMRTAA